MIFCPVLNFCILSWASHGKILAYIMNCRYWFHHWNKILHFMALQLVKSGQNWIKVFKVGQKSKKFKTSHKNMPQKNAELIFAWFQVFVIFLPNFEDFNPILATFDKLHGNEMKNLISIVEWLMTVNHLSQYLAMGGPNENARIQNRAKNHKNWKSAKNSFCIFLRHPCMYHGVSYLKKIPEPCW